jgi:hypothetical protein
VDLEKEKEVKARGPDSGAGVTGLIPDASGQFYRGGLCWPRTLRATKRWSRTRAVRPVSGCRDVQAWPCDQTLLGSRNWTLLWCVRSSVTYTGISIASKRSEAECGPDAGACQVDFERMRPISENRL